MDKLISPPNYHKHEGYGSPARILGDAAGRSRVCARPLATSCSGCGSNVSQGLKQQLFLAGRCCEAVTPACHTKNVRRECSVSSQTSLENRNIRFVQLIFQRKGTSPQPALRKPRMTQEGAPWSLIPKRTRAEQR